jgi:hydrogenase maturation protease
VTEILVIGCGNPLRADDGVGRYAAERLEELEIPGVRCIPCHQLTVELCEPVSRAGRVVFIDAREGGPGELEVREIPPAGAETEAGSFSHHLDASRLLAMAEVLYGRAPGAVEITVGGLDFGYREALSPEVAARLPELVERVREMARGAEG